MISITNLYDAIKQHARISNADTSVLSYVTLLTLIFHPSKENIRASHFPRREALLQAGKWHSKR